MVRLLWVFVFLGFGLAVSAQDDPVLMRINGKEVLRSEFERSYNKDGTSVGAGRKALDVYVNKFIDFRLKIEAAEVAGLDTSCVFQKEQDEYRRCLIKSYLTDEEMTEHAARQYYDKMKAGGHAGRVHVKHIFKYLPQNISGHTLREMEYKMEHDADALLKKMAGISFVVNPTRQNAITRGTLGGDDEDDYVVEMDDAAWHLETIEEKNLPVDEINAYNHMAIYLRWCMEHDLVGEEFLAEYGSVVEKVKADPANVDLREFIRDELDGQLVGPLFNKIGRAFASYYYGEADSPYFPGDIDNYALEYFGSEQYYSDKFQDEAYLFIPFDENYYQAMAKVMEKRFVNWQGQSFDEATLEPSEVAQAIMEYLDCECTYFPSMTDDDPIMSAYNYAKRESLKEGFVPVLIKADDETLLECLVMNADPDNDADIYEFDLKTVTEYRKKMLSAPIKDGKAVLEELTGQRKEEAEDDDMDWDEEVLGEMEGGYDNRRFSSYWNSDNDMTYPLILAKIPVKNPWELFAWLPFGNWNECPDTPELMAVAKYWFEQHGAVPAAMSHDELEFLLPAPVSQEKAMEVAAEQYGFCPDIVDQEQDDPTVGNLADVLRQSTVWYFWWD